MIPQDFIDELVRDADLLAIVGRYVKLTAKGKNHKGLCPFHNEKTPSFSVDPDKGFYHCFGCNESGNALTFLLKHVHGNNFVAAVEDLAQSVGREVPRQDTGPRVPVELLEKMRRYYHSTLMRNEVVKKYLKERGITGEIANRFSLGYAPKNGGLKEVFGSDPKIHKSLIQVGLARPEKNGGIWAYFRDRVMFPITTATGKMVGFGGRVVGSGEPKYLNSPQSAAFNKSRMVYGLREAAQAARADDELLVVEGYMDVVMLARYGIGNTVATMGTAATAIQLNQILQRVAKVVFCFDGDNAGRKAADKVLTNVMPVLKDGKSIKFAFLAEGEDPDSFVTKHGAEKFRAFISEALPLEQVLLNFPSKQDDVSAAQASADMHRIAELIETIDREKAPFLYEHLYKLLSEKSKISPTDLKRAAQTLRSQEPPLPSRQSAFRPQTNPPAHHTSAAHWRAADEQISDLLACLSIRPKLAAKVKLDDSGVLVLRGSADNILPEVLAKLPQSNVADLLGAAGHHELAKQVQAKVKKWQRSNINPQTKFDAIVHQAQIKAEQKKRKSENQAKMNKQEKTKA